MHAISAIVGKLRTVYENVGIVAPRTLCPFRFLDLPAEIRLLIYQELFGGSRAHMVLEWVKQNPTQEIKYESESFERRRERVHGPLLHFDHNNTSCRFQSAVLRSCKAVHDEALPVLYANPVFQILIFAGGDQLPIVNAAHIRRITTRALEQETLKEHEIAEGYQSAGIQWDKLLLFAIDMGNGLGTGLVKDESADAIERAITGRATPIEYEASDVAWLFKASSASELKRLGICVKPLPESWYVRKGSTALRDQLPKTKTPINYTAHGSRLHVLNHRGTNS